MIQINVKHPRMYSLALGGALFEQGGNEAPDTQLLCTPASNAYGHRQLSVPNVAFSLPPPQVTIECSNKEGGGGGG